ncbi:MAG: HEAT repeat protein [Akkermansiaceae bacterium]|jgi:HEAT repeat protein
MKLSRHLSLAFATLLTLPATGAGPKVEMTMPDFTKGDPIPEGASHDWNLGATGARGWIFSDKMVTSDARQISVTKVTKGSPAENILGVGDVILGVDGKRFSYDPRTEMGKALTSAEASDGKLSLIRWRDGKEEAVTLPLPVLGSYSSTAPYNCPKSQHILTQGCQILAKRIEEKDYRENPISRSLNALALLASGDEKYLPIVRKEAEWASRFSNNSMQTWYYGYAIMLLAEYTMATGDKAFMDGLRRLSLEAANGQSIVGSWGHRFANPDGRLAGYGMMNAPGIPLTISLVMARAAGVDDPVLTRAIDRSTRLLRFYTGKGALPYGDHNPWIETHEDNGKSGMTSVLFNLLNEPKPAEFFAKMSLASHGPERDTGHTGNFFNILWSLPSVAQSGPHATGAWMKEFGAWYFDLARQWDGTFVHLGPPEPKRDSYANWDCTGAYLLAYAMPLKKIFLTGKRPSIAPQLDASTAKRIVLAGRGWNNKDRTSAYDTMNGDTLLECLSSWSPVVRERAAMALARRKEVQIKPLIKLLKSSDLESQYGASQALTALRGRGALAIDALKDNLSSQDLWLRIKSAEALAAIGKPAMAVAPKLLKLMTQVDLKNDPRGMQQRYLSFALFNNRGGMLSRSLEGVDRKTLFKAVRAGLKNEDGRARGSLGSVFRNLSQEEIKPLLPAILEAVEKPSPSGIMFADEIRMEGLQILSKHHLKEGIAACADYLQTQNPWASEKRTPRITELLLKYGTHATSAIPTLKKTAAYFAAGEQNFPKKLSLQKAKILEETIQAIESANQTPKLLRLK